MRFNLTFRKIEMVEAVAKLGSVSAAARALGVSQPALTQGIKAIETELAVKLFNRDSGNLAPTSFAVPFLSYVDQIRMELFEAKRDLERYAAEPKLSKLRICAGIRSCFLWVDAAVSTMRRVRPDIDIQIDYNLLNLYSRLVTGEVDIGVTMTDLLPASSDRLVIEPLGKWRALFVCRREHPLAQLDYVTLDQLRQYPLAGDFNFPVVLRMFNEEMNALGQLDVSKGWPIANVQVNTLDELIGVVRTRDCLCIVSRDPVADELENGSLVELNLKDRPHFYLELVLAYLGDQKLSSELRLFIDTVKAVEEGRR